jgi:CBS domain-containing protein
MNAAIKISDVMTTDVFTLSASTPAETAAWELSTRGFTGAPVQDDRGRLVGVLSRSDLSDPERYSGRFETTEVRDLMTPAFFSLGAWEPVSRAAQLMVREGIGRVVVMDRAGQMVGIVTSSDILRRADGDRAAAGLPRPSRGASAETNFAPI